MNRALPVLAHLVATLALPAQAETRELLSVIPTQAGEVISVIPAQAGTQEVLSIIIPAQAETRELPATPPHPPVIPAQAGIQEVPPHLPLPRVEITQPRPPSGSLLPTPPDVAPVTLRISTAQDLARPGKGSLAAVLRNDPAVGENYAITGYYENFTVRGFTLDHGNSYRINGLLVPGELHFGLDVFQSVEVLRGAGNLTGGLVGPPGTINLVTRRPVDVGAVRLEATSWGGTSASVDLGRAPEATTGFGWRLVAGHEALRPAEHRARGERTFFAGAFDWRANSAWRIEADLATSRRSQPAVPGFQLLGGTMLPDVDPRTNINQQPWSRPVRNDASLLAVRATGALASALRLQLAASDAQARIDDSLAFPFGCNAPPFHYFCADGGYVLYDYRAHEQRRTSHGTASLEGEAIAGTTRHAWRIGAEASLRRIVQRGLYSSTLYDADGHAQSGRLDAVAQPLPAPPTDGTDPPVRQATQSTLFVADRIAWRSLRLDLGWRLVRIAQRPSDVATRAHSLPQAALSWQATPADLLFVNAARSMETGTDAPLVAHNAGALLAPRSLRQLEAGWRHDAAGGNRFGLTLFRIERPFQFTEPQGVSWAGLGDFVQRGRELHTGLEADAHGRLAPALVLRADAAALRAVASGTGSVFDGRQVQNVPRWRSSLRLVATPARGVSAELAWLRVGARSARPDGAVHVPGYDRFDADVAWTLHERGGTRWQLRAAIDNLANARYWRDVGQAYSADLLFPGRPRTVSVAVTVDWH